MEMRGFCRTQLLDMTGPGREGQDQLSPHAFGTRDLLQTTLARVFVGVIYLAFLPESLALC